MVRADYMRQYYAANKDRINAWRRRYRADRKDAVADEALRHKYGSSLSQKLAIIEAQGFKCATCFSVIGNDAHLDHCHKSGKIRGVLCRACNQALGLVNDRPEVLIALADYLKASQNGSR